jgi:sugar lactone lactonase YvrE
MKAIRVLLRTAAAAVVIATVLGSLTAASASASGRRAFFPARIDLPAGFRPEGIAIRGTTFFVGSLADGSIYRGDLRTGEGAVIGGAGGTSVGLAIDRHGRVFAAGGASGGARVIDGKTGEVIQTFDLASAAPSFVNDVVIARGSAWFTDSQQPVLYRVPLDLGPAETIPLTGDLVYQQGFNVNGIDATENGKRLVLVQTNTGSLFTAGFDGVTKMIDLGTESVPNGDGILLEGRTLFVVQNQMNKIAVIDLDRRLSSGTVITRITSDDFSVPTTIDRFGRRLYAVNARFGIETPEYWITAVRIPHSAFGHHDDDHK